MIDSAAASTAERSRILFLALFAWTVTNLDQSLFGYAIPGILQEFDADLGTIGYILAISFAVAAVLVSAAGLVADRYGRRFTLVVLLASSALFVSLQAFAHTLTLLTVCRALAFGLSGGLAPVTAAYVAETAPARHRGLLIGILQCGYPLGWFLASLIAAPLLAGYGWRAPFLFGLVVIPLAFIIGRYLPESRHFTAAREVDPGDGSRPAPVRSGVAELFSPQYRRRSVACMVLYLAYGSAYAGSAFFFPTYFTEVRGYTPSDAAYMVGLSYGCSVLGYLGAALVGEHILTRRNTAMIWSMLGCAALLALLWLPSTRWHDTVFFAVTAMFFFGMNAVVATLLTELYPTRLRATGYAVCGSAPLSIGFAVYPMIIPAAVSQLGWQLALSVAVAPLLLIVTAAAAVLPNLRSGAEMTD